MGVLPENCSFPLEIFNGVLGSGEPGTVYLKTGSIDLVFP